MSEAIVVSRKDHVVVATLNRGENRNPISDPEMVEAFCDLCADIDRDREARVLILTGAGKSFSAGGNVKHMRDRVDLFAGNPSEIRQSYRHGIQRIPKAFYNLEIPTIAAVNGAAVGAGCDLAMMCDMRIASTHAKFSESFVKLGIIPGDGGAWFLPRAIGWSRAAEMLFTGDMIDAQTALEYGMVSRVVAPDALLDEAQALAFRIAANPPAAVRMTKKLLRLAQHSSLDGILEHSAAMQALAHHSDDHSKAIAGFFDKEKKSYEGR